ncbi:MAG: flagellar hook-basal body complex protein FliE [Lachnospiraceae bacterium]|nr:flagellar hook-basal body complex protein FliE [Lachnospiraceae bacterium]
MNIMNISAINRLEDVSRYQTVNPLADMTGQTEETSFDSLLSSAMNLVNQTEEYSNKAEEEEIKYAMGQSDSLHDLLIAQQKANVSLQYTVAVKNTAVEAYRTLMNMQF